MEEGVTYDYVTACVEDSSKTAVGHATFSDYRIIEEDAELGLEMKEGYEWRTLHVSIVFDDENARKYAVLVGYFYADYYDNEGEDDSVDYHGTEYERTFTYTDKWLGWVNGTNTYEADVYVNVPTGYDGFVFGLYDTKNSWEDGMHIDDVADDNTLFFRMD